jgi:hypothetical protein
MSSRSDILAQEAARRLAASEAPSIEAALRDAVAAFGGEEWPLPTTTRIRRHLELATAAAVGQEAAASQRAAMIRSVIEVAEALQWAFEDLSIAAVGRLAEGFIDAFSPVHLRLYSTTDIAQIAEFLRAQECGDPVVTSQKTTTGIAERVECVADTLQLSFLKVPSRGDVMVKKHLMKGTPIAVTPIETLRKWIDSH